MLTLGMLAIKWIYWLFTGAWLFPHLSGEVILLALFLGFVGAAIEIFAISIAIELIGIKKCD